MLDADTEPTPGDAERSEPDLALYSDLLLLVDSLERANPDASDEIETSEQAVYDIEESAYVHKAEIDEEMKTSRLQGLKDRVEATEGQMRE